MTNINNRVWVIGGMLLTAVILLAGWFLGISPVLGQAAAADRERAAVVEKNRTELLKLESLKERSAGLEELQALVEGQRKMLPAKADIAALIGQLSAMQEANGVVLTDFAVSDGLLFEPPTEEAADVEQGATESTDGDAPTDPDVGLANEAQEPDVDSAPSIPNASLVTSENFVAIPVAVSAAGSFEQLLSFVQSVQSGERLFLVTELSVGEDEQNLTFKADLTGYVYVLIDPTASEESATEAAKSATATLD